MYTRVADVDLVVVRDAEVSVPSGRCFHRGGLLGAGHLGGDDRTCGVHGWGYRVDTGIGGSDGSEVLGTFRARVDGDEDAGVGRGDRHDGGLGR